MEHEYFKTLEEFVQWELRVNKGSKTRLTTRVISYIFSDLYPDEIPNKLTKNYMIDKILEKRSLLDIYEEFKETEFGIRISKWKEKFDLNNYQVKKMVSQGFLLKEAYKSYEKVFTGTYNMVSYYQADKYFNTTIQEVEKWKEENIRGYKKVK